MTDIDFKGKRVNNPKEIKLDSQLYDINKLIQEEFARQINRNLINSEEGKVIIKFIKNSQK